VVTFAAAWAAAPPFVILTPKTAAAAGLGVYASSTTTTLTIGAANLPTASTVYSFDYQVVGGT